MIPLAPWIPSINSLQKPVEFQSLVLSDQPLEMVPGSLLETPASGMVGTKVTTQLLETDCLRNGVQAPYSTPGGQVIV